MLHNCGGDGDRVTEVPLEVSKQEFKVRSNGFVVCFPPVTVTGLKSGCQQGCFLLGALGENRFPCLCQFLQATCISWLLVPSSIFSASNIASSSLLHWLLPLSHRLFSNINPLAFVSRGHLWLLWAHLDHPGFSAHPQILNHFCKISFAM